MRFNCMSTLLRKSLVVLFLFFSVNVIASFGNDASAQFLGQQSLSQSSYVIDQSGNLWAWGDNFYGQLGLGDRKNRNTPVQVPVPAGASKWVLVAGGQHFAIAVADSDKLYAWGLNDKGQIGIGVDDGIYGVPTRIQNPEGVTTWKWVSAGAADCEALTTDGRLFAWGDNVDGELGVGTTEYLITPQPVQFPTGVTAWEDVAAGPGYTMMIASNGLLYGSGMDSLSTFTPWEGPVLGEPNPFRAFSPLPCLAASYRLETRIDEIYFSGPAYNYLYQSPIGGAPNSMAAVADGGQHLLLLTMAGVVLTAGDNTYGQLGVGSTQNVLDGTIPFPSGVTQFVAIAAGLNHSLAIGNDGWLYTWGDDSVGELGIGPVPNQSSPVRVFKVCDPLAMTASITAPSTLVPGYTIKVNVHDDASSPALTSTNAYLVLNQVLTYQNSAPEQYYGPQIPPNDTGSMSWGITDSTAYESDTPLYYAYVRANGSAPLLVTGQTIVNAEWITAHIYANVEDSITNDPLVDAYVYASGGIIGGVTTPYGTTDTTDQLGNFTDTLRLIYDSFLCEIVKENYNTFSIGPYHEEDSIDYETFYLGPSAVQGTFTQPGTPFIADSIQKVYYPDSLIGYALSRRVIFQTLDSGIHWSAIYIANQDLHDVKFIDAAHGWAVGDSGTIVSTTDSGITWQTTRIGTKTLRALAVIDFDTAWAVGDSGTLLKKSGDTWNTMPKLGTNNLNAIHFLSAEAGIIGTYNGYYLYSSGNWSWYFLNFYAPTPIPDIRTVYYIHPGEFFLAGTNGYILNYNAANFPFPTLTIDYKNTTHTINSLYFLNKGVGYALGDSGSSLVTYDGGASWAPMQEFPYNATSVNFFSLAGHGAAEDGVQNYDGTACVVNAIVRGRITYGNPAEPIMGAQIVRVYEAYADTVPVYNYIDTAYTNEQGNYVFSGIDGVFPYEYHIHFSDSGIAKTKIFTGIKAQRHEITTLNYNDYTAPPPDTILAGVDQASQAALSLDVSASQTLAQISYMLPTAGSTKLILQDVLGRTVRTISNGFVNAGTQETVVPFDGLVAGTYYVTLETTEGSITKKFVVLQ